MMAARTIDPPIDGKSANEAPVPGAMPQSAPTGTGAAHPANRKAAVTWPEAPVAGLVSVVVPVFNREQSVGRTLDSILAQTYGKLEILAVDDGSTDRSRQVLEEYARRFSDRLIVLSQANAGPAAARNRGLRSCRGEFIAFLDSDDIWRPRKLELQLPLFSPGIGLVYSAVEEVDDEGTLLRAVPCEPQMRGDIYRHLLVHNRMTGGSVVVTRTALDTVGLFDERLRAAENWDLWIRISKEFEVDFVDRPLARYAIHPDRLSHDSTRMQTAAAAVLSKHFPHPPDRNDPLLDSYNRAYAHHYHLLGVHHFTRQEYREARRMFRRCREHVPGFRDSGIRYLRTFLGKRPNDALARLRKVLTG